MTTVEENPHDRRRIALQLPNRLIAGIDRLRLEWGLRSRGDAVARLLDQVLNDAVIADTPADTDGPPSAGDPPEGFDEAGALVLIAEQKGGGLGADFETSADHSPRSSQHKPSGSSSGIDLPGFVRRQSEQLRQSLQPPSASESHQREPLPLVGQADIRHAFDTAQQHWLELYGTSPNANVLEAAMAWLAMDIWPHVDQSEGRPFTWSLAGTLAQQVAPSWPPGQPSFEKVIVLAGLLEDPFSAATLSMRTPTLIRRFVHRMRRRQRGMSFETLENTMSLHGALKLLHLPTTPGHRLSLADIREAYREQALQHHPDSGGNPEQMRKLNEAYQMLKELYRSN